MLFLGEVQYILNRYVVSLLDANRRLVYVVIDQHLGNTGAGENSHPLRCYRMLAFSYFPTNRLIWLLDLSHLTSYV